MDGSGEVLGLAGIDAKGSHYVDCRGWIVLQVQGIQRRSRMISKKAIAIWRNIAVLFEKLRYGLRGVKGDPSKWLFVQDSHRHVVVTTAATTLTANVYVSKVNERDVTICFGFLEENVELALGIYWRQH